MKTFTKYTEIRKLLKAQLRADIKTLREAIKAAPMDAPADTWTRHALRDNLTAGKWSRYLDGRITRREAVEIAIKRGTATLEKKYTRDVERLANIERVPLPDDMNINLFWTGYTARVNADIVTRDVIETSVDVNSGHEYQFATSIYNRVAGYAGGYGYDKTSAAVADALNKDPRALKILCEIKERSLRAGMSDHSAGACTGHNNREVVGYGAGYNIIPYYEGGVGVSCYWSILEKLGYRVTTTYGHEETFYHVTADWKHTYYYRTYGADAWNIAKEV